MTIHKEHRLRWTVAALIVAAGVMISGTHLHTASSTDIAGSPWADSPLAGSPWVNAPLAASPWVQPNNS